MTSIHGPDTEQREQAPRSNLQLRVMSALVLIVVVLALTWWGGVAFRLFAVAMGAAVFVEWSILARAHYSAYYRIAVRLLLAVILGLVVAGFGAPMVFAATATAVGIAAVLAAVFRQGFGLAVGFAYAVVPAAALAYLRGADNAGLWTILFLFACVWATDILAYFSGRAFGGPKLAPSISPSKTWSGAAGGTVAGVAAGLAVALTGPWALGIASAILIAAAVSVVSQFGDLFESAYKRRHGAKDSGNLIPGHGGVMDRVDGLVAGAAMLFVVAILVSGAGAPAQGLFGY